MNFGVKYYIICILVLNVFLGHTRNPCLMANEVNAAPYRLLSV